MGLFSLTLPSTKDIQRRETSFKMPYLVCSVGSINLFKPFGCHLIVTSSFVSFILELCHI